MQICFSWIYCRQRATMLRVTFLAVLLALGVNTATAVEPRIAGSDSDFRSIVPADWRLLPPDPNRRERRFVSPTGDAWLALSATPAENQSIQTHMDEVRSGNDERITYQSQGAGWIVVSGYRGDRIFYRKAMLACSNHRWHQLAFEYPASEKRAFDAFVTRASYALKAYGRSGCRN
jgi:hypothetical protein